MFDFSSVQVGDGRTRPFELVDLPGIGGEGHPILHLAYAGSDNEDYIRSIVSDPTQYERDDPGDRGNLTPLQRGNLEIQERRRSIETTAAHFATSIIKGWENLPQADGTAAPYSPDAARDLMLQLPAWIRAKIISFAGNPANFVGSGAAAIDAGAAGKP